jgi:predicted aldo/keto reductase-like oxidoreductase
MILVPVNIVNRAPLDELLPLCRERGVGVTIMKPLATGLLPATLALKWLLNQSGVDAVAPGATTLEQLEENAAVGQRELTLTSEERARVQGLVQHWARRRCRICALCQPCPREIPISMHLGTDVMYDHYRTMGAEAFRRFPWSDHVIAEELEKRVEHMARIRSCSECGECEPRCPYGLPIVDMLRAMLPNMESMMRIYESLVPERGIAHPAAE